jgi:hypothetical protein
MTLSITVKMHVIYVKLNVIMPNVVMLSGMFFVNPSGIMPNVIMMSVVAPFVKDALAFIRA